MTTKNKIIVGVGLVTLAFVLYNEKQKSNDKPKVYLRKKMFNNYNARTIPPFGIYILESQKDNKALLEHEMIHWRQYQEKGLIKFYLDYSNQLSQYGYDKMPMEIEARFNESDFCKQNYTHCVRNGISNTIFNPNFLK